MRHRKAESWLTSKYALNSGLENRKIPHRSDLLFQEDLLSNNLSIFFTSQATAP